MLIEKRKIKAGIKAETWEEAILAMGKVFEEEGSANDNYSRAMVDSVKELGPYIVIVPHVALAHSAPSENVYKNDVGMLILDEPVNFNSINDPVNIVIGLCAKDNTSHIELLQFISTILGDDEVIEELCKCKTSNEAYDVLCAIPV